MAYKKIKTTYQISFKPIFGGSLHGNVHQIFFEFYYSLILEVTEDTQTHFTTLKLSPAQTFQFRKKQGLYLRKKVAVTYGRTDRQT